MGITKMNESISVSSLMNISDKARSIQKKKIRSSSRQISEQLLKPLFETLGWEFDDSADSSSWSRPCITYDARRDIYSGRIGGQPQLVTAGIKDDSSISETTRLIGYAYNKNTAWALTVSPRNLRLFHTYGNVLLNEDKMTPFWESEVDILPKIQDDLERYLSASAATNGVLCTLDRDVSGKQQVALPVTRKLFESTRHWRSQMVEKIYRGKLLNCDLNETDRCVNHILNQMVFIRVAEDRRFGESPYLMEILNQWEESGKKPSALLSQLESLIGYYARRYKVELFSNNLLLDAVFIEELMADLIRSLHSPGFPTVRYDFSVIDVDVLGTMYEQYLKLKPQVVVKSEASLQKRLMGSESVTELKANAISPGVHYTPKYIVDYIVDSALRRWKKGKSNNPPRVLDMACGSGSFLLSSYKWLLRQTEKQNGSPLSRKDKQLLLRRAIWGVDKDPRAVEICKLNLWLDALESRHSLPNLDKNIRVGDSLLDSSLGDENPQMLVNDTIENAIIWNRDFAGVMKDGGWDLIVGNPPYIRIQRLQDEEKEAYLKGFKLLHGNFDISLAFVEMSQRLLNKTGVAAFIIANSLLRSNSASLIRKEIVKQESLLGIIDFGDQKVFEGVGAYTCIVFLSKEKTTNPRMGVILRLAACPAAQLIRWEVEDAYDETLVAGEIGISRLGGAPWVLVPDKEHNLREKIEKIGIPLERMTRIFQGFKTGRDEAFVLKNVRDEGDILEIMTSKGKRLKIEKELCQPLLKGGDIERFHNPCSEHWILFPYKNGELIPEETLRSKYTEAWVYLNTDHIKKLLLSRKQVIEGKAKWYAYSFPKSMTLYSEPKVLTPDIAPQASFAYDEEGRYCFSGGAAGGYGLILTQPDVQYEFLLGLLNSSLMDWYVQAIAAQFQGGYYSYEKRFIKNAPIRVDDNQGKQNIISIVKMLRRTYSETASSGIKKDYEYREIANIVSRLESELNEAVMNYYDLTSADKQLVRMSPYWRKVNFMSRNKNVASF